MNSEDQTLTPKELEELPKNWRYKPKAGNEWNPLMRWPRNALCYCGSALKFKKCCHGRTSLYCTEREAGQYRNLMKEKGYV